MTFIIKGHEIFITPYEVKIGMVFDTWFFISCGLIWWYRYLKKKELK